MIKTWEWVKDHGGYVYLLFFTAVGVDEIVRVHDVTWGVVNFAVALLFFYLYQFGPFRRPKPGGSMPVKTFEEGEVRAILSSATPVIPGDLDRHRLLNPNCTLCELENDD